MNLTAIRGDTTAFVLAALAVVAITVLASLGHPIPDVLTTVALVAVGAGGGAAVPRPPVTTPTVTTPPVVSPPVAPVLAPAYTEPPADATLMFQGFPVVQP